ncbi:tol-pal system protein [Paracoccus sp. (in: a-proteobacteria)]|uniref:tol-pal system protein n=1 Tax=Paracoccus sp. TaxID=267 RepID=UPI0026E07DE6|nr:tol-pal system protein [Paracoccus sp. (in: a-proteobacteria)]MDO5647891.1 tol-pal system protein [Paracoccus sp. (in: a-proteobacteria)]
MRGAFLAALMMVTPVLAVAEPRLADIRAELTTLRSDLQSLRAELRASGAAGYQAVGGAAAIDRMNGIEERLTRLTDDSERLQNRISRIATDSERRLADLEFRVCELDDTCDLSQLTMPVPAGDGGLLAPVRPVEDAAALPSTAAEQQDFDRAQRLLDDGDYAAAADLFGHVARAHAGGPLTADALYLRGLALDSAGDPRGAAVAWLEGFSADPDGKRGGASLLGIARVIAGEGNATAACLYLAEIPARFPGSDAATEAEMRMTNFGCGTADLGTFDPLLDPNLNPEAAADLLEHQ